MNVTDISLLSRYDEFDHSEATVIKVFQVVAEVIGVFTLLLYFFNLWNYLIKRKKYRDISILLFYVNALLAILMIMIRTYFVPVRNYCNVYIILLTYGIPLCNLNLGICQACMLTQLYVRLNQLFIFKIDLKKDEIPEIKTKRL